MFSTTAASFSLPMSLVGVALFAGAAFGAYMMARTHRIAFRWSGVVSALLVGIASGLVVIILAAIFRISTPYEDTAVITFSGASFRTFALTFLIAAAGALTGHFLADKAPASSNVFLAAWHWRTSTHPCARSSNPPRLHRRVHRHQHHRDLLHHRSQRPDHVVVPHASAAGTVLYAR